jgi:hypothetical protein
LAAGLGSVAFGTASALAGIWLGHWLTRRSEETRWRRDRRFDSYADFIDAAGDFNLSAARYRAAVAGGLPAEIALRRSNFDDVYAQLDRTATRVQLIAPAATRLLIISLMDQATTNVHNPLISANPPTQPQLQTALQIFIQRLDAVMQAARQEFGAV